MTPATRLREQEDAMCDFCLPVLTGSLFCMKMISKKVRAWSFPIGRVK